MKPVLVAVVSVVVIAAVGGGAFYGGMKYGQNQVIEDPMQYLGQGRDGAGPFVVQGDDLQGGGQFPRMRGTPQAGGQGFNRGFGGAFDTVQSVDGSTVTVTRQDGTTVQVITTNTTLIQKYSAVTVDALEPGEQVIVSGSNNDDGTITARSIRSMTGMQFGAEEQPAAQP